jgi:hypothetical protein
MPSINRRKPGSETCRMPVASGVASASWSRSTQPAYSRVNSVVVSTHVSRNQPSSTLL